MSSNRQNQEAHGAKHLRWGTFNLDTFAEGKSIRVEQWLREVKVQFEVTQRLDIDLLLCRASRDGSVKCGYQVNAEVQESLDASEVMLDKLGISLKGKDGAKALSEAGDSGVQEAGPDGRDEAPSAGDFEIGIRVDSMAPGTEQVVFRAGGFDRDFYDQSSNFSKGDD